MAGLQLVRAAGTSVDFLGTVGSDEKAAIVKAAGATAVYNRRADGGWLAGVRADGVEGAVDAVVDCVAGAYVAENLAVVGVDATIVQLAFLGGRQMTDVNLGPALVKRVNWRFTTLRARPLHYKRALVADFGRFFATHTSSLRPHVHHVFDDGDAGVDQLAAAHDMVAKDENVGKVVVRIANEQQ